MRAVRRLPINAVIRRDMSFLSTDFVIADKTLCAELGRVNRRARICSIPGGIILLPRFKDHGVFFHVSTGPLMRFAINLMCRFRQNDRNTLISCVFQNQVVLQLNLETL